ncbi:glycosylphosphatidylinositol-specific phospholipase C [Trypanosoma cruzi marinkellei]|uniref:Glycosylphosphatidylinositol-specific phospholipase C n=1 Tax=Trypanosoma cruzi marinkellei TaxID=85056 RepID=K2NCA9_TRYCR|nr:glycosylphosphatidylinositol-specific phospholipase C [Trypanosoma cruzi marinkellei]
MSSANDDFTRTAWHPQSWMNDIRSFIGDMAITQVCFVGAHDAASYGVRREAPYGADAPEFLLGDTIFAPLSRFLFRRVCTAWSRCQGMSVRAQLDHGVRYLDLRVATNPEDLSKLYTLHQQISVPLADVLEDVKSFLRDPFSRNEFLVLDFQHMYFAVDSEWQAKFFQELDRLSDFFIPAAVSLTTPLEMLWRASSEKRIFLVMGRREGETIYPEARFRSKCMVSRWVDKFSLRELLQALTKLLQDELKHPRTGVPSKLCVTQAVCTPRRGNWFASLFSRITRAYASIFQTANGVNSSLFEWYYLLNAYGILDGTKVVIPSGINTHRNIIMVDFVDVGSCRIMDGTVETNAVGMCVYLNILRAELLYEGSLAAPSLQED